MLSLIIEYGSCVAAAVFFLILAVVLLGMLVCAVAAVRGAYRASWDAAYAKTVLGCRARAESEEARETDRVRA